MHCQLRRDVPGGEVKLELKRDTFFNFGSDPSWTEGSRGRRHQLN